jgi:hypothetical protein
VLLKKINNFWGRSLGLKKVWSDHYFGEELHFFAYR